MITDLTHTTEKLTKDAIFLASRSLSTRECAVIRHNALVRKSEKGECKIILDDHVGEINQSKIKA